VFAGNANGSRMNATYAAIFIFLTALLGTITAGLELWKTVVSTKFDDSKPPVVRPKADAPIRRRLIGWGALLLICVVVFVGVAVGFGPQIWQAVFPAPDLRICGSSTTNTKLVPDLIRGYFESYNSKEPIPEEDSTTKRISWTGYITPEAGREKREKREKRVKIAVDSRGSETGFAELLAGNCDISFESEEASKDWIRKFAEAGRGRLRSEGSEFLIGRDEVVVAVNTYVKNQLGLKQISIERLCKVFSNSRIKWDEIDPTLNISKDALRVVRNSDSGTGKAFQFFLDDRCKKWARQNQHNRIIGFIMMGSGLHS